MKKLIVSRYNIESQSTNKTYVVAEYDDGSYACSCPSWIFHKGTKINCKHINEVIAKKDTPTKESTLTITGLTPTQAELVYQKALELTKQKEVVV